VRCEYKRTYCQFYIYTTTSTSPTSPTTKCIRCARHNNDTRSLPSEDEMRALLATAGNAQTAASAYLNVVSLYESDVDNGTIGMFKDAIDSSVEFPCTGSCLNV
jgi:hypothetical protein